MAKVVDVVAQVGELLDERPTEALALLLESWRRRFDPGVAQVIERLGANLARELEGLPTKKGDRAAALARLAERAPDAERSAVLAAFEVFGREATGALVWPSVEAWANVEPDPRVARMALRVLVALDVKLTAKLWRRLVNCIERHGDGGVVADGRPYEVTLKKRGDKAYLARFSNVLKKLESGRACTDPIDRASVDRLLARLGASAQGPTATKAPSVDEEALLAAIVDHPDDDGPRLVYADALLERRDARGELIVLQVARARARGRVSKEGREREAELLASQRTILLGPLRDVVAKSGLRFERGFLVACRATGRIPAHPFTRLLERVQLDQGFERGARFDALVSAEGPPPPARDLLPKVAPRLRRWKVDGGQHLALIEAMRSLALEELSIARLDAPRLDAALGALFDSPATRQLRRLELSLGRDCDHALRIAGAPDTLEELVIDGDLVARFTRTKASAAWDVELDARYFPRRDAIARSLPRLFAPFRRTPLGTARILLPRRDVAALRELFERQVPAAKRTFQERS